MKYKILIADDIFVNRILLSEIVEETGAESIMAKNGKEAIDIIQQNDDINLVLMDIEMPVMNGIETTEHIKKNLSEPKCNIPIVAITAHDSNSFLDEYNEVGFDELITKPYSVAKLEGIINKLLK